MKSGTTTAPFEFARLKRALEQSEAEVLAEFYADDLERRME